MSAKPVAAPPQPASAPAWDVVTLGESMALIQPLQPGLLAHAPLLTLAMGGAESNLAIALARLGRRVRWISRLGADPFGDLLLNTVRGEGVDTSAVTRDPDAPTAVYFRETKGTSEPSVFYYRAGSAASRFTADHVTPEWLAGARLLHLTGITPALGEGPRAAVFALVEAAQEAGVPIAFDPNLRRKLWDASTARRVLLDLARRCDLFLPGAEEAAFLLDEGTPEDHAARFLAMGPKMVAIKQGKAGAFGAMAGCRLQVAATPVERVVDPIGAGDAFDAGFLSVLLAEPHPVEIAKERRMAVLRAALQRGCRMGSLATQFAGDWEGLPTLAELERQEQNTPLHTR